MNLLDAIIGWQQRREREKRRAEELRQREVEALEKLAQAAQDRKCSQ